MNYRAFKSESQMLLRLALPVTLSQVTLMGMGITDVIVAGRAGTDQLAGMTLGNSMWNLVSYFFFGIGLAAQPLIGHAFGAGDRRAIRRQFQQAIYTGLVAGLLCFVSAILVSRLMLFMGYAPHLAQIGSSYLLVIAFASIAMTLLPVLRSTLESMNQTIVVTKCLFSAFLINIPLDFLLVFGWGPIPAMGSVGCAYASLIVLWLIVTVLFCLLGPRSKNRHLRLLKSFTGPNVATIKTNLKLGIPIGITITAELSFFVSAAMLIGYFGAIPTSAHSVAISAASVCYMFYMGLGQGVTIRASQLLGAGKPINAWYSIRVGVFLTTGFACVISVLIYALRFKIPALYSNDPSVIELAAVLLVWAAIFQIVDAVQCLGIHGLRAYKDTRMPLRFQLLAFWGIGFPVGYLLANNELSLFYGPEGYWVGLCTGLAISAILISRHLWKVGRKGQLLA